MTRTVYTVTTLPARAKPHTSLRARLRGLCAAVAFMAGAADALVTAALGLPPVTFIVRRFGAAVRRAYRAGAAPPPVLATTVRPAVVARTPADPAVRGDV
jgi:hypothetical protein